MTPTVADLAYRPRIQFANAMARVQECLGVGLGRLDEGSILEAARRETGLSDFGDPSFLKAFQRIVHELSEADGFTPLARILHRQSLLRSMRLRLQLQHRLQSRPEVRRTPIARPIFVLGFPRTGTTLLQNLLSLHPERRGLPFWELSQPVPGSGCSMRDHRARRRQARWLLRGAYQMAPEMGEVHYIDVDTVEECWWLFTPSFAVMNWDLQTGLTGWGDYLMHEHDMVAAYREYRQALQIICAHRPAGQLVLKCPEHLFFVEELLTVFPDACIVQTHRDPYDAVGSYCSLISMQWRNLYGRIDRRRIGAHIEQRMLDGMTRARAARARADPSRFFDVSFEALCADPAAVVRQIADHFDLDLAPDHDTAVAKYLAHRRRDAPGRHHYDPADYGLDRENLHERFRHVGVAS